MDLALLEDFLELARELNFSRAASRRNLTQPAFSRRIKTLEEAMQTPLVNRTTRHVTLTPAGKAFQPHAATMIRLMNDAKLEVLEAAGRAQRSLNLAATHALSYHFVPAWLMRVAGPAEFGTLNLVSDTLYQCALLMQHGEASFFICHKGISNLQNLPEKQFRHHPIGRDLLAPLCAPDEDGNPLWRLDGAQDDLPYISYGGASGLHSILEDHWAAHGRPKLKQVMSSVLAATNLEMAKKGQGVAFLPLSLCENDLAHGRLIRAGGADSDVPVSVVIYRPRSRLSAHCEAFWQQVTRDN